MSNHNLAREKFEEGMTDFVSHNYGRSIDGKVTIRESHRRDVRDFLELAAEIPIIPSLQEFALEDANRALRELKTRKIRGAKVLVVE